jgi:hypothetical protein
MLCCSVGSESKESGPIDIDGLTQSRIAKILFVEPAKISRSQAEESVSGYLGSGSCFSRTRCARSFPPRVPIPPELKKDNKFVPIDCEEVLLYHKSALLSVSSL